LTSDHDENEETLQSVDQIGGVPQIVRAANEPGEHINYPSQAHHNHQLHADSFQRRSKHEDRHEKKVQNLNVIAGCGVFKERLLKITQKIT
jgi:hypothetical protein